MRVMVTSLLLLLSAEAVAAAPPAAFMARWAAKEQKLEALYAQYWRTEYAIAKGNVQLSSVEIQKQIREQEPIRNFCRNSRPRSWLIRCCAAGENYCWTKPR